jgi:tetratricopeptide (TPR) repeat protein
VRPYINSLGRFAESFEAYSRALELAPDLYEAAVERSLVYARWTGELDSLRAVLDRLPPSLAPEQQLRLAVWAFDAEQVLRITETGDDVDVSQFTVSSRHLMRGVALRTLGQDSLARQAFLRARQVLGQYAADNPEDHRVHSGLGWAYAGLGMDEEAVRSADRYRAGAPYPPNDVYFQGTVLAEAARVLALAGRGEQAIALLRRKQLRNVTRTELESDIRWDRVRETPAFRTYLEELRAQESERDTDASR